MHRIAGHLAVPGDKSISHRAVLIGAISEGETRITGFGRSADTEATIDAVRALGVTVVEHDHETLDVYGKGLRGLVSARHTDRLPQRRHARAPAGRHPRRPERRHFELAGDESLSARPMRRVTEPLGRMGAGVATEDGHLPLGIDARPLRGISYELPVASAQVKSAILLAGLYAEGETTVVEPAPTRDHTELLLQAAGATVTRRDSSVTVQPAQRLELGSVEVPGDFSSAAPFIVAATLVPGSELHIHGVNLNPRRTGLLDILERMGGRITAYNRRRIAGEPAGDLDVRSAELVATTVTAADVPRTIDELPLFVLAASCARGDSVLHGAEELRAKESDRIEATADALRALGQHVRATSDGFRIRGVPARPRGGGVEPRRPPHRDARSGGRARLAAGRGDRGSRIRGSKLPRLLRRWSTRSAVEAAA